jgi:HlyD family secretion protein
MTIATTPSAPLATEPSDTSTHVGGARIALAFRVALFALVAAGAIAIAIGVQYRFAHTATPVHYETTLVDRGAIAAKVTATGSLSALVTVSVGAQVSGRIEKLTVDFESHVRRGEVIATIEPSLFEAAVAQARANYAAAVSAVDKARAQEVQAQRDYTRAKGLLADSVLSQADFDAAEANLRVAQAQVASSQSGVDQTKAALGQAELNLSYCTVRSPIDGVVISRNVDVGQTVAAALQAPTLFTIAQDLTHMQVDTNVAEADIGKIRANMRVSFTVDAYPTKTFSGVVRQVRDNAQTIQNVVTYDAVIDVDNAERLLKPSMTANVTFVYATREGVLRVPNAALRFKPDAATIAIMAGSPNASHAAANATSADERIAWTLRDGHASPAKVRIGIGDGESTELVAGDVREGDALIVEATSGASATKGRSP